MTASIGNTPFELVDETAVHPAYNGPDRRRARPRVAVSDSLGKARRGAWGVTFTRIVVLVTLWTVLVAPHLMDPGLTAIRTGVPLVYALAEISGLAVVLSFLVRLARAATHY
jgi:hypothetical protein